MGQLVKGEWRDEWYDTKSTGGKFVRQDAAFRGWLGSDDFPAVAGRYHLYVSYACPWAHRALIFRELKQLQDMISVSVVDAYMGENGWEFSDTDPLYGKHYMHEIYTLAKADYSGRVTVPVLWDKEQQTIVSNESSEIIRMFNSAFGERGTDYYPEHLREDIDSINEFVYHNINNGVYKAGFATTQAAYHEAVLQLFQALDKIEQRLAQQTYLVGNTLTEADWRLFTTLVRFDAVYVGHFKCNIRRIADYPALSRYLKSLYETPGIATTVHMDHIKQHYYQSHKTLNPTGIVPAGPELTFL